MNNSSKIPPVPLILIDAVGMILIGIGFYEKFARGSVVPVDWQYNDYDIHMIIFGAILAMPVFVWHMRRVFNTDKEI